MIDPHEEAKGAAGAEESREDDEATDAGRDELRAALLRVYCADPEDPAVHLEMHRHFYGY